jgi:hypothetical protein
MWSGAGIQVPAREFFAQRCSTTNTEACVLAGEWTSAEASSGMERLQWFDKACTAGNSSGCLRLAQAALTDGTDTGLEEACGRFGDSISAACRERSELCRLSLFCAAVAGDDAARARLRAACRDAAASQDCKLFPELRAAPPSGELQR